MDEYNTSAWEDVRFQITDVEGGWIFAELKTETARAGLSNSYLGGLQMPGVFLKTMLELLSEREQEKWICWHGESNSYIWHLTAEMERLELRIYEGGSSFGMPLEGGALEKNAESSQIILKADTLLHLFALSVCDAFRFYSWGKGYAIWQNSRYRDMFLGAEYSQLRKMLRGGKNLYSQLS